MSRRWVEALVAVLLTTGCAPTEAPTGGVTPEVAKQAGIAAAQAAIADFGPELKAALQAGLTEGPVAAVEICHTRAAEIAADAGARHDVRIGRTALRVRNRANAPDAWERESLLAFERALSGGAAPDTVSAYTVTGPGNGRLTHRYMQPIMMQPLCLTCHGKELAPAVAGRIEALYPEDKARGFESGQLRGAFTVTWPTGSE